MMKHGDIEAMTLRDYFAAEAMRAMTSDMQRVKSLASASKALGRSYSAMVAIQSYQMADAMLEARKT